MLENKNQSKGWCHVRNNKQDFLTSCKLRIEARKNIASNLSFVIGNEKYSQKYMCFDHKNFAVKVSVVQFIYLFIYFEQGCHDGSPS